MQEREYEIDEFFCLLFQCFFGTFEVRNLSWELPLVASENMIL